MVRIGHLLTPAFVPDSGRMNVRSIGTSMAGMPRAFCRVRRRHCCRLLPSEPDVKVSLHPAQAVAKPRVNRAGQRENNSPCLDDTRLRPADRARTFEPVE